MRQHPRCVCQITTAPRLNSRDGETSAALYAARKGCTAALGGIGIAHLKEYHLSCMKLQVTMRHALRQECDRSWTAHCIHASLLLGLYSDGILKAPSYMPLAVSVCHTATGAE